MNQEMRAASLILCLGILLATIQDGTAERRIVCYYTNWSVYRPGTAKFSPQNINPYLCTHLIYAFGGFTKENALKPFDKYQDIEKGGYAKFTGLKTYNKNLKTMLAIGGWNEGSSRFSPMVADSARRREFVKNAVKFLRQNHFDGLDLDWEYPAFRDGGKPRDKDNYANLVQELRDEFERESSKTGRPRLLLSMAMPAGVEYIDKGYDVPRLNEYLDFVNLLTYDYHSAYEPAVNHHSPLYPLEEDNEYNYDAELTIDYTISHLLEKGMSADKIVLGIPTYGRSYTLFNQEATDLGSPADGPGTEGEATREKGYLAYYEICESIAESDDWEVVQPNPKAMGPYAFKGNQWVGYDDENVVKLKAHYVNEKKLGGIMFWSIDNDDFRGKCHGRAYPLIEAAKEALLADNRGTTDKTKSVDSRKKIRTQSSQSNTRKSSTSNRRSSTTSPPITSKRVSSSRPKYRTISQASKEEQEDREVLRRSYDPSSNDDSEGRNTVTVTEKIERPKNRNRVKTQSSTTNSGTRRKQSRRKGQNKTNESQESLSNKLTTPEPPTTPDPGTDFKCEDEGFFPHPRDCKKYFWCLDSGPGGLGVVAHQFTCPSGLVFNKGADSCDYPRNVICPKTLKSIISTGSTTKAPITAATSRTTYLHSTTTAKAESEEYDSEEDYDEIEESEEKEEEEEEEEDDEEEKNVKEEPMIITTAKSLIYKTLTRNRPSTTTTTTTTLKPSESEKIIADEDEEDPKVIKELIDLIKKAGGIEELEKQLLLQEKNLDRSGSENVTPATISRSLYERVLNRQASKVGSQRPILSSSETSYVNGPGRAQFEGLDDIPEVKSLRRSQKPQYVTIERSKSNVKEFSSENEDENEESDNADVASSEEKTISNPLGDISSSTERVTPNYINIRRTRLSTTTSRTENDVEEKEIEIEEEKPTRRRRPFVSSKQNNEASSETSKSFRRRGPSVRKSEKKDDSKSTDRLAEKNDDSSTTKSRYSNVQRFRTTTSKSSEDLSGSSEVISETISPIKVEEYPEVPKTTASTAASLPITSTTTTSTSTEIITLISVEPSENSSSVNSKVDVSSTIDPVKLVEDSATEILFTTLPAGTSSPLATSTTLPSRSTIAVVSQPRPFGFARRRSGSSEATTTATTPLSRSKVADSEVIKLPTLKELIGYPTTYDDRTTTMSSSILLHLLRNEVDNDINRQNVEESLRRIIESQDGEKEIVQSSRDITQETADSWLEQASENKARSRAPRMEDIATFDEEVSVTNAIQSGENKQKALTTSTYFKPTTMRGIPLASLTTSSVIRGFYITRSKDDPASSTSTFSSTPAYAQANTFGKQQTETTLISDISTTEPATVTHRDRIESKSDIFNNINNIAHNKSINNEESYFAPSSSTTFSKDSDSDRPMSKKTNLLHNFDRTTPLSNSYITSPATPMRRRTALTANRYSEVTTPLWSGKRIAARKRNRTTIPPARDTIRQTETDNSIRAATSALRNASVSTDYSASTLSSRRRKLISTIPTASSIVLNYTSLEILDVHDTSANLNGTVTGDLKTHSPTEIIPTTNERIAIAKAPAVATDATITTTPSIESIESEITSLNNFLTDNSTVGDSVATSTLASTGIEIISVTTNSSTTPILDTATNVQQIAIDSENTTAAKTTNADIDGISTIVNYSTIVIPTAINMHDGITDAISVTDANEVDETISTIENYSTFTTEAIENTTIPITATISISTTLSPLTTVISSTENTQSINATVSMTINNLADINTAAANMTTTPLNLIVPTITDFNAITMSAYANVPSAINTPSIISQSKIMSTNSAAFLTSTAESSATYPVNLNNDLTTIDMNESFEALAEATTESAQTAEIRTTFTTPSTRTANTPSTPFFTLITNRPTVSLERFTTSTTPFATFGDSITTNLMYQTTTNVPDTYSVRAVNRKSEIPEWKTNINEVTSTEAQSRPEEQIIMTANKSNSVQTMSENSTISEIKTVFETAILKNTESRKQDQTTSKVETTNHQFNQKTARRRILNRTNNWLGSPLTLQRTNQYSRHRVTHRGKSRRPSPYISSSKIIEKNVGSQLEEKNLIKVVNISSDSNNTNFEKSFSKSPDIDEKLSDKRTTKRRMRVVLKSIRSKSEEKNSTVKETNVKTDSINLQNNLSNNVSINQNSSNEEVVKRRMRVILKRVKLKSEVRAEDDSTNESLQGTFSNNFYSAKNHPDEYKARRRMRVVLKSVKPKSDEKNSTAERTNVDSDSTDKNFQSAILNNSRTDKNPVEHGTKRRTRVVLKSIKPKFDEQNSRTEETNINSDSVEKDFQGSSASSFYINENLSGEKKIRVEMDAELESVKSKSKEEDSIPEETNINSDFAKKHSQVLYTVHFSSSPSVDDDLLNKNKKHKFEEKEAMTERPEDTEAQTTRMSVPVEQDTDSLEVTSNRLISRNPGNGYFNRQRKPASFTTIAPLTNPLSNTLPVHQRRRPVETTLSSRIDYVAFEDTEPYVKSTAVLQDQNAEVSDQSIHAQEFDVMLSNPPPSSSSIGQTSLRDTDRRKISTTVAPRTDPTISRTAPRYELNFRSRQKPRAKDGPTLNATTRPRRPPVIDYDYYEDEVPIIINKSALGSKLFLTNKGTIRCLDQGNFPHPYSCKKFITCARMVNGQVIGTEYTCPDRLSFDPIGGICNWSAGLGCKD
ncbi:uncharacterized protein [Cardiocondyla obscurior]|uniref:uncharacterized protein isoform X2 n=1 Tax=Cardiocondyla obscurior TaxID=286306 RepID=UPI0039656203